MDGSAPAFGVAAAAKLGGAAAKGGGPAADREATAAKGGHAVAKSGGAPEQPEIVAEEVKDEAKQCGAAAKQCGSTANQCKVTIGESFFAATPDRSAAPEREFGAARCKSGTKGRRIGGAMPISAATPDIFVTKPK